MDKNDIQKKILEEEDYIKSPKHSNSIAKYVNRNPDGGEDATIARLLMISEEEVAKLHEEAVEVLRKEMVK
jgi:hypothetical protein